MKMTGISAWMCLIVFVLPASQLTAAASMSADPPANIKVTDPGHLGHLTIEWSQPSSLQNLTDCTVSYQLSFYDTYARRWKSVRTLRLSYAAQFDLEKPVQVRMLTLIKGACTNGTEILGEEVKFEHTPEHTGIPGSRIRGFHCIYFNKEHMDCTWEQGSVTPSSSKHYLYYWHREMQEAEECPKYIPSLEVRKGCRFPPHTLLEFSEFNVCVNGSSTAGPLSPAYFSLEVQNHVKPAIVSNLQVVVEGSVVQAHWEAPAGRVPEQCLEYELETTRQLIDGRVWKCTNKTEEMSSDFLWEGKVGRSCFQVRSKVNGYCADEGFWSDWSQSKCIPDTGVNDNPGCHVLVLLGTLAIVIIVVLVFFLILWMFKKMWMNRKEQILYPLYQEKVQQAVSPLFISMFQ
ncbi:interleukin-13 receptor subunit alpha-2 [Electrophorus electricus]|uniref:Type I cytokine receptor cytokine-binding domain-containing protein n=1 Tax=Electrophorus electricus TaxID=8005 RepID=A0A4W4F5Z7_ELEEL|nr:interleukin-13 receptor subunit alpha-2 [Electrophorus electricus]